MQHEVERTLSQTSLYEYYNNIGATCHINPGDDCGRGTTIYSYHRVGYDGQDQVLSAQHAVVVLGALLFVSTNGNQNPLTDPEAQSYVQRNDRRLEENICS